MSFPGVPVEVMGMVAATCLIYPSLADLVEFCEDKKEDILVQIC